MQFNEYFATYRFVIICALKKEATSTSHFCLISFTTIVGCSMHDCHCRKRLYFPTQAGSLHSVVVNQFVSLVFYMEDTTRKNKTFIDWEIQDGETQNKIHWGSSTPRTM